MSNLIGNNFRVTEVDIVTRERKVSIVDKNELKKIRSKQLKKIRKEELRLTQKELSDAIGVNIRTLQDWELGRNSATKPVELLMNIMRRYPNIKKEVIEHSY